LAFCLKIEQRLVAGVERLNGLSGTLEHKIYLCLEIILSLGKLDNGYLKEEGEGIDSS